MSCFFILARLVPSPGMFFPLHGSSLRLALRWFYDRYFTSPVSVCLACLAPARRLGGPLRASVHIGVATAPVVRCCLLVSEFRAVDTCALVDLFARAPIG